MFPNHAWLDLYLPHLVGIDYPKRGGPWADPELFRRMMERADADEWSGLQEFIDGEPDEAGYRSALGLIGIDGPEILTAQIVEGSNGGKDADWERLVRTDGTAHRLWAQVCVPPEDDVGCFTHSIEVNVGKDEWNVLYEYDHLLQTYTRESVRMGAVLKLLRAYERVEPYKDLPQPELADQVPQLIRQLASLETAKREVGDLFFAPAPTVSGIEEFLRSNKVSVDDVRTLCEDRVLPTRLTPSYRWKVLTSEMEVIVLSVTDNPLPGSKRPPKTIAQRTAWMADARKAIDRTRILGETIWEHRRTLLDGSGPLPPLLPDESP